MKALEFEGSGSEYFKIWIVNILLTIVTLGFYYPWAKVRNKRYFYANSTLEGRNFEYHAVGKQLLIGYLIGMTLLVAYVVIQKISPIGSLIVIGIFALMLPWIIYRSMMFNMRMTSFSNVHFKFIGKVSKAYLNFLGYPLVLYFGLILSYYLILKLMMLIGINAAVSGIITLMIVVFFAVYGMAFLKKKNTEYFIDNTLYGQSAFKTNLDIKKLMLIALKTIGVSILALVTTLVIAAIITYLTVGVESVVGLAGVKDDPELLKEAMSSLIPIFIFVYGGMLIMMVFVGAYSHVRHRNYMFENTNLDEDVTFASTLEVLPFAWVLISNFILIILTLGLATPWAKVRVAKIILTNTLVNANNGFDHYMSQNQTNPSAIGEQIGEAFDVDVGIGF